MPARSSSCTGWAISGKKNPVGRLLRSDHGGVRRDDKDVGDTHGDLLVSVGWASANHVRLCGGDAFLLDGCPFRPSHPLRMRPSLWRKYSQSHRGSAPCDAYVTSFHKHRIARASTRTTPNIETGNHHDQRRLHPRPVDLPHRMAAVDRILRRARPSTPSPPHGPANTTPSEETRLNAADQAGVRHRRTDRTLRRTSSNSSTPRRW